MNTIQGIDYITAKFDKRGKPEKLEPLPDGTTDLFVISHGWRNNEAEATKLYTDFFTNFANPGIVASDRLKGRKCAIVGVFWPSKNFDFLIAAQGAGTPSNAASLDDVQSDEESKDKLIAQLNKLKDTGLFDESAQRQRLDEALSCIPYLDDKATAREKFIDQLRKLMDREAADKEDASEIFFTIDQNELFKRLNFSARTVDPAIPKTGKAMAFDPDTGVAADGHAAGLLDIFKGTAAAASNIVSYLSYFMMKERAGAVGRNGVAPLIDQLERPGLRIHLIGHSFGGRVAAAAALASKNPNIQSLTLLQAAFSHNGFSPATLMNGLFRPVIELQRVKGPIIATHTKNDTAVGIAYPLASRISGTVAAALGDENDEYGGLGRNGAQQMLPGEVIKAELQPMGGSYKLTPGKFHNLLADPFIKNHGDVTGPEVVAAMAAAAL